MLESHSAISLPIVVGAASIAWLTQFVVSWRNSFGINTLPRVFEVFGYPQVLFELMAQAAGAAFVFPAVHITVASLWKSKRTAATRRRIFLGWSIAILVLGVLSLALKTR